MFKNLILLLSITTFMSAAQFRDALAHPATLAEAVTWLESESHRLIRASKRTMEDGTAAFPPQVGIGYEAFWLRDYAYTLEGSIDSYSEKELRQAYKLFIRSIRADGAGVDCVAFDGRPIYKPGLGKMGANPVADGSQFTVAVAWHTYQKTKDSEFLGEIVDTLVKTMNAVPRNLETGLVHIKDSEWDRCPYGFTDTVRMQGDVLFCSLLYVEAGRRLSDLLSTVDRKDDAARWKREAEKVAGSIRHVFWDSQTGLFRAATIRCREHHIWGSAFAVYLGVADESQSRTIAMYFRENYSQIVQNGQIRHLPGHVYWERCSAAHDTYQNGAYWATPAGWFVYTLDLVDPKLADQTVIDLVADFQKNGACEWVFGERHRLPNYLASASLPLAGIRAMIERRRTNASFEIPAGSKDRR
ncbi:MAG: hypothetical protein JSW59_04480 [Phycisphaerales bacterium]|nr:MAG: hypothetical protein JSW59_04480 [Phycisphaerales bacterium]